MVITTTSAAALAAGSAVAIGARGPAAGRLFLLTLIAGVLMVVAGLLRLGRYTRFVSHSVMIGFLTGVAVNIVARPDPRPHRRGGGGPVRARQGVRRPHASRVDRPRLARRRTRRDRHPDLVGAHPWASFGAIVALAVPTLVVPGLDATGGAVSSTWVRFRRVCRCRTCPT